MYVLNKLVQSRIVASYGPTIQDEYLHILIAGPKTKLHNCSAQGIILFHPYHNNVKNIFYRIEIYRKL